MNKDGLWKIISFIELALAAVVIFLDLLIPTLIILALCAISLVARHEGIRSLGFKKIESPLKMVLIISALVVLWTFLQLGLIMPLASHLTGTTQDVSAYEDVKGNVGSLVFLLAMTWSLAAVGEEIVYRGYLQVRTRDLFGNSNVGVFVAIAITSVLFGIAHSEQGTVGIVVTTLDAVFFSAVKLKFDDNLWAAVLTHGLSNTLGFLAFFLMGPIHNLW